MTQPVLVPQPPASPIVGGAGAPVPGRRRGRRATTLSTRDRLTLAAMVARSDERIDVMAGGGVTADSVEGILRTGVPAIHFSAKRTVPGESGVSMGSAETDGVGSYDTVDVGQARRIAAAVRAFGGGAD